MSFTFVQGAVSSTASGTASVALGSNVTTGNILVCASKTQISAGTPTVVVSSLSGASLVWTQIIAPQASIANSFSGTLWYAPITATTTETVQAAWVGGANIFTDIVVAEYSCSTGFASPALDVSTSTAKPVASTTGTTGTTSSTAVANELVVAVMDCWNSVQTWGVVSGYTNRATASRNTTGFYDAFISSTGTQSFTVTITSDIDLGMIATFKASGGAVTTDPPFQNQSNLQPIMNFPSIIVV